MLIFKLDPQYRPWGANQRRYLAELTKNDFFVEHFYSDLPPLPANLDDRSLRPHGETPRRVGSANRDASSKNDGELQRRRLRVGSHHWQELRGRDFVGPQHDHIFHNYML